MFQGAVLSLRQGRAGSAQRAAAQGRDPARVPGGERAKREDHATARGGAVTLHQRKVPAPVRTQPPGRRALPCDGADAPRHVWTFRDVPSRALCNKIHREGAAAMQKLLIVTVGSGGVTTAAATAATTTTTPAAVVATPLRLHRQRHRQLSGRGGSHHKPGENWKGTQTVQACHGRTGAQRARRCERRRLWCEYSRLLRVQGRVGRGGEVTVACGALSCTLRQKLRGRPCVHRSMRALLLPVRPHDVLA